MKVSCLEVDRFMVNSFEDNKHTFLFNIESTAQKENFKKIQNFSIAFAMDIMLQGSTITFYCSYDGDLKYDFSTETVWVFPERQGS